MLHLFGPTGAHLLSPGSEAALSSGFTWIDCFQPTREEERLIETTLGIEIPTRQEMLEIEVSNRLYEEGAVLYMTTTMVSKSDSAAPENGPVTFILTPKHLVTLRYNEYMPFRTFIADFQRNPTLWPTADKIFAGLADKVVERLADVLEKVGFEIETLSADLFKHQSNIKTRTRTPFQKQPSPRELLNRIGYAGNLDSKIRESLVSQQRMLTFLNDKHTAAFSPEAKSVMQGCATDIQSLCEHSYFLSDKLTFLLDASLGLINIDQNDIIRIFSIAAVMFMPPTLIASLYGMNFKAMPELGWPYGYEYALVLMVLSTIIPVLFFKKKGWL